MRFRNTILFALLATTLFTLGGCVYGPGYYQRTGVVYDDDRYGSTAYADSYPDYYAYPAYYYGPGYGYGYGYYPWLSLGFSGTYYRGGHHYYHNGGGTYHHSHHH